MSKKGVLIRNVLILLTGMAAVVLVILFATGTFGKIGDIFSKVSSIEITAQACGGYSSAGLESSYCNLFQKVDISGTKQYVTCKYLETKPEVVFDEWSGTCTSDQSALAEARCETLKDNKVVNGEVCYEKDSEDDWGVSKDNP